MSALWRALRCFVSRFLGQVLGRVECLAWIVGSFLWKGLRLLLNLCHFGWFWLFCWCLFGGTGYFFHSTPCPSATGFPLGPRRRQAAEQRNSRNNWKSTSQLGIIIWRERNNLWNHKSARSIYIYIYVYMCIYIYVYIYMHACMHACMYLSIYLSVCLSVYVSMYLCIYVSIYVSMYVSMYVCMHACMHVCMYVCMYVCICVCV